MEVSDNFVIEPWNIGYDLGEIDIPKALKYIKNKVPHIDDIKKVVLLSDYIDQIRKNNSIALLSLPYFEFAMCADILKCPGELIEAYFCKDITKMNPSLENGDRIIDGRTFQFKVSIISAERRSAQFNRIQIWQQTDEYRFVIIDKQNRYRPYFYSLTKDDMKDELILLHACAHNSTKEANRENKKIPSSIRLFCSNKSEHFRRWEEKYRAKHFETMYYDVAA
jgi:hypothetical protein